MVYIRNSFRCEEIALENNDLECIGLKIILSPQMYFSLIVIYRPPDEKVDFYEKFRSMLSSCNFDKEVIIMGDFNVNWEDRTDRKNLKQISDNFDLTQVVKGPTKITQSTRTQIDLIFSNKPERVTKSFKMITGISDHNLVLVTRKLTRKRFCGSKPKEQEIYKIPNKEQERFKSTINLNWSNLLEGKGVHEGSTALSNKLQCFIKDFLRKLKNRNTKSSLPWINADIIKNDERTRYGQKKG